MNRTSQRSRISEARALIRGACECAVYAEEDRTFRREYLEEASLKAGDAASILSLAGRAVDAEGRRERAAKLEGISMGLDEIARTLRSKADSTRIEDTERAMPGSYVGF